MKFIKQCVLILLVFAVQIVSAAITGVSFTSIRIEGGTTFGDGGKLWVINFNARDTDYISGTLSPQELKDSSGSESKQTFTIKMTSKDEYATYSFIKRGDLYDSLFDVDLIRISYCEGLLCSLFGGGNPSGTFETLKTWIANNCIDIDRDGRPEAQTRSPIYTGLGTTFHEAWCAKANVVYGTPAGVSTPKEIFITDWEISVSGKTPEKVTLSNDNNVGAGISTKLGDNTLIKWQGNLDTGADPPEPIGILGVHSNQFASQWRLIDEKNYDVWALYIQNSLTTCIRNWVTSGGSSLTEAECEEAVKIRVKNVIVQSTNQQFTTGVIVTDTSVTNGKMKMDLAENIAIPNFVLYIDADYLEIVIPTGIPQITSVSSEIFREKSQGAVTANIKNVGNGDGSFDIRVSLCSSSFNPTGIVQHADLKPNATATLSFTISGSSESLTEKFIGGTCTVEMKETTTQQTVSATTKVSFEQENECIPNNQRPVITKTGLWQIVKCGADGLTETVIKTCAEGEEIKFNLLGQAECFKPSIIGTGGTSAGIKDTETGKATTNNNKPLDEFPLLPVLIIVIVIGAFVIVIILRVTRKKKRKRR